MRPGRRPVSLGLAGRRCGLDLRLVLVRRNHHCHVAAVLLRCGLHDAEIADVLGESLQQPEAQLRSGLLPAPEHDRHLDLVSVLEEAPDMALLRLVVMGVDLRAELLLLDDGELLVAAGLAGLLRALVLELAVVHELADRRPCLSGDLDQVKVSFPRQSQGVFDAHDADLLAVGSDEPDLGYADAVVDARLCADGVSSVSGSCVELNVLINVDDHEWIPQPQQRPRRLMAPRPADRSAYTSTAYAQPPPLPAAGPDP